jgi:hypothetical protein
MSDNTLKTKNEWQYTQEKCEHYSSRKVSTIAQERFTRKVDHNGSS